MNVEQITIILMIMASILAGLEFYSRCKLRLKNPIALGSVMVIFPLSVAFSAYVFVW